MAEFGVTVNGDLLEEELYDINDSNDVRVGETVEVSGGAIMDWQR